MTVHHNFLKENLVNRMLVYVSPTLIGSFNKKQQIVIDNFYQIGRDFHFVANFTENKDV